MEKCQPDAKVKEKLEGGDEEHAPLVPLVFRKKRDARDKESFFHVLSTRSTSAHSYQVLTRKLLHRSVELTEKLSLSYVGTVSSRARIALPAEQTQIRVISIVVNINKLYTVYVRSYHIPKLVKCDTKLFQVFQPPPENQET